MSNASVILLTSGDAPASVPTEREALYLTSGLGLRRQSSSGLVVPIDFAATPGHYSRDIPWAAKTVAVAADRYVLLTPNQMGVSVDGVGLYLAAQQALDLSLAATWDTTSGTDYTVAANRAGKDFYVYCCLVGGMFLQLVVSANSTYPSGYAAATSRKVGGFHCLCASVGVIDGHPASGYVAGDIIPVSVWDLKHRPACSPEGMRYVAGVNIWQDIYIPSVVGGILTPVFGGTIADGVSSPAFDWYDFVEWLGRIGKRPPTQAEFMAGSVGSNEGTNIAGSSDPVTSGGHIDTDGRRMISATFGEDYCGALWQWGVDPGGPYAAASWADQGSVRTSQGGQGYNVPNRALLGGSWVDSASCGSRCSNWNNTPLFLNANYGARGVADPLDVGM